MNYILNVLVVLGVIIYGLVVYLFGWCHSREFYINKIPTCELEKNEEINEMDGIEFVLRSFRFEYIDKYDCEELGKEIKGEKLKGVQFVLKSMSCFED